MTAIEPQTPPGPFVITSEYLDYLIGILTGTVTPKAGAEFIPVLEIARAAQLGTAWAEYFTVPPNLNILAALLDLFADAVAIGSAIENGTPREDLDFTEFCGSVATVRATIRIAEKAAVTGGVD